MKVALIQMESKVGYINENFHIHKNIIEKTFLNENVDIFCFPEASLTGYSIDLAREIALTESTKELYINKFLQLSKKYNCLILFGIFEKTEDLFFISHYGVSTEGINSYKKIHIGKKEKDIFAEGAKIESFKYRDIKYGIQLCYDLHFPEMSTIQAIKGANIIFSPHAVPKIAGDRKSIWNKYVCARAYDNSLYVACCNQTEKNESKFSGGITIFSPKGEIIDEYYKSNQHLLLFEMNVKLEEQSKKKKFILNRRPGCYNEILMED